MKDQVLRENLIELLSSEQAHITAKRALNVNNLELCNVRPRTGVHSVWELLEHMRIAQEDILRYTLEASWESPAWPDGYWPVVRGELTEEMWAASVSSFFADLDEVVKLVRDPDIDLLAVIPHGEGRTYLREVLLVADHNAYHLGQIIQTRKTIGDWVE